MYYMYNMYLFKLSSTFNTKSYAQFGNRWYDVVNVKRNMYYIHYFNSTLGYLIDFHRVAITGATEFRIYD